MNDELHPNASSNVPDDSLLALNLSIGDALQLQDTSALKLRYYVKLIGFLNKAGVIVSHPLINGALLPLEVGRSFLVRGFSGRKTYEFNADVLSFSAIPYPHLHLAFPKKVECMTMPGALRIKPESLEGWIEPLRADSVSFKIPMTIIDISTSGARVHVQSKFGNIGDEMKVMFRLAIDEEEQAFSIPAVIRKSYNETLPRGLDGMEGTTHGLEFIQPEGGVRMALQGYIYRTMAGG
ncbi:MAG: flagellar brake protein [Pseudomonadota bacterium]